MSFHIHEPRSPPIPAYPMTSTSRHSSLSSPPPPPPFQSEPYTGMSATYSPGEHLPRPGPTPITPSFPHHSSSSGPNTPGISSRASSHSLGSMMSGGTEFGDTASLLPGISKHMSFHPSSPSNNAAYHALSRRQFRRLLWDSSFRWLLSGALCGAYLLVILYYTRKGTLSDLQKRHFNAWTTGISICLGLNLASSFRDMALNMRWHILSMRKRNLREVDMLLHCGSMTQLCRLIFVGKRPLRIIVCVTWIVFNILAQVGVAMLSLTFSVDNDPNHALFQLGNVSTCDMSDFFSPADQSQNSRTNREYLSHAYGSLAYSYKISDSTTYPQPQSLWTSDTAILWPTSKQETWGYVFYDDSPANLMVFTSRIIESSTVCKRYTITAVDQKSGAVTFRDFAPPKPKSLQTWLNYATNYVIDSGDQLCPNGDPRCALVQAYELKDPAGKEQAWYYRCEATVGRVSGVTPQMDPRFDVSDTMASIAAGSIASPGPKRPVGTDGDWQKSVFFNNQSVWGQPGNGNAANISTRVGLYAIGAIAGAAAYNPHFNYTGQAPQPGLYLYLKYPNYFYLIIGLTAAVHGIGFLTVAAVLNFNEVLVTEDSPLAIARLLRDAVADVEREYENAINSGMEEKDVEPKILRGRKAVYGMGRDGRWVLR